MKSLTYTHARVACYIGYMVQAAVNNLTPLLFITFNKDFNISLEQIGLIIFLNFAIQICVDITSALYVDRIGYRASAFISHMMSFLGFLFLGTLPFIMSNPLVGIIISVFFLSVGGGLIEVIISPMVESIPSKNKAFEMSVLHSFYCWGQMLTILLSTFLFVIIGISNWRFVAIGWSILPLFNAVAFLFVPVSSLPTDNANAKKGRGIISPAFACLVILMICSGASELAMSQWASLFFESVLKIDKSVGDLLGPCVFALLMGVGRILTVTVLKGIQLENMLIISGVLGIASYLAVSLTASPVISLIGCALCGLAVSAMWPSTYSLGTKYCPLGGTLIFALLAFSGDIGCVLGPEIVAIVSGAVQNVLPSNFISIISGTAEERGMRIGLLAIAIFPIIAVVSSLILKGIDKRKSAPPEERVSAQM